MKHRCSATSPNGILQEPPMPMHRFFTLRQLLARIRSGQIKKMEPATRQVRQIKTRLLGADPGDVAVKTGWWTWRAYASIVRNFRLTSNCAEQNSELAPIWFEWADQVAQSEVCIVCSDMFRYFAADLLRSKNSTFSKGEMPTMHLNDAFCTSKTVGRHHRQVGATVIESDTLQS